MKKAGLLLVAILGTAAAAFAADAGAAAVVSSPGLTVTGAINWTAGTISMEVTRALDPAIPSQLRAKQDAETDIEARVNEFVARAVAPLAVDSSHTLGDLLGSDPALFTRFTALDLGSRRDELFLAEDFSSLVARYTLPFFGDGGIVTTLLPSRVSALPRRFGPSTAGRYTGLLVYATGRLPEVGTGRTAAARPALFPRLWDEQMNLVLDKGMCDPAALARWGLAVPVTSPDANEAFLRLGLHPLRLAARGVFGDSPTDLVIPTDGAMQLLAVPENRELLRQGRIAIVYDTAALVGQHQ
jgi:hypothetical protein